MYPCGSFKITVNRKGMNNWQKVINICLAIFITLYIYNMDKFEKQISELSADIKNLQIKLDSIASQE